MAKNRHFNFTPEENVIRMLSQRSNQTKVTEDLSSIDHNKNLSSEPQHAHAIVARILVVEDNDFNQEIALELLTRLGYIVDIAENGRAAISKLLNVSNQFYNLIFMDLEMPEMDGHTATLAIRNLKQFDHIPIIALTAHENDAMRAQCKQSGMQDYLAKPFNFKQLIMVLETWLQKPLQNSLANLPACANELSLFSTLHHIDANNGLKNVAGNVDLYVELLMRYNKSQQFALTPIQGFIHADFHRVIHTLKSLSATIGARSVEAAAKVVEHFIENHNPTHPLDLDLLQNIAYLQQELNIVLTEISLFLSTQSAPTSAMIQSPPDNKSTKEIVLKLRSYLENSTIEVVDYFESIQPQLCLIIGDNHDKQLSLLISAYDFDGALRLLHEIDVLHSHINP